MNKPMFQRSGHFWISFINNKENGRWICAANAATAKFLFAEKEGVRVSSYIVSSKKGYKE